VVLKLIQIQLQQLVFLDYLQPVKLLVECMDQIVLVVTH
jgi:hypothetical protein